MAAHFSNLLLPTVRLVGVCNRCGACCRTAEWRCAHLRDVEDGVTECTRYADRYDGMPITLRYADGSSGTGTCKKDSPAETAIILPHVGGSCSLTIQMEAPPCQTP